MYKVIWTPTARNAYYSTLEYWLERNKSNSYPLKIVDEVELVEKSIAENPYLLAKFIEERKLYRRLFFKRKFAVFYEIKKENIIIKYFKGTKQESI